MHSHQSAAITPFANVRRFASPRIIQERRERCELCCAALPSEHRHLLEVATRNIVCAATHAPCGSRRQPPGASSSFRKTPLPSPMPLPPTPPPLPNLTPLPPPLPPTPPPPPSSLPPPPPPPLSSPIILYDYPKIAPKSPGDLFDAAEIDEILTLRIMAMTDHEKREMRQVDEQARRILERTETLPEEHLLKMHGVLRGVRPLDEDFFNPAARIETVSVGGVQLQAGSRVRIRPKSRADVMDLALAGKTAVNESHRGCDAEDRIQLALVLDDDPGKGLGMMRQPGHRFFYGVDEIEPVKEEE